MLTLAVGLGALGFLLLTPFLTQGPVMPEVRLPGLALLPVFVVAGALVVHLRLGKESHGITLRDLAVVVGLATVSPVAYVLVHVTGALLPVVVRGMSGLKLAFNAGLVLAEAGLATAVYRTCLQDGDALGLRGVAASYATVLAVDLFSTAAVTLVIGVRTGHLERPRVQVVGLGLAAALVSASVALLGLVLLVTEPGALPLLAGLLLALALGYRSQVRLIAGNDRLEVLYAVTRAAGRALADDTVEGAVLGEAREVMQAERVELHLLQDGDLPARSVVVDDGGHSGGPLSEQRWWSEALAGEVVHRTASQTSGGPGDALAVPLHRDGQVCGALTAANRLGDGASFTAADAQVFAALAGTVSVSLNNAGLLRRLRSQAQRREYELRHDGLTGLLNRRGLMERLEAVDSAHVLLCLQLKELVQVQDALGYQVADAVLTTLAERLSQAFPHARLARLGDAEFALLVRGADRDAVAHRVRACLTEPFASGGLRLPLRTHMGSLLLPQDDADGALLLRRADLALSRANRLQLEHAGYDPDDEVASRDRLALVGELRDALNSSGLSVVYQPQLDLASGRVRSVEALCRWTHPTRGPVSPDRFVPLAEQSGLIDDLTALVLRTALADAALWRAEGLLDQVGINLSAATLTAPGLADTLREALAVADLPAEALTLELTETAVVADPRGAAVVLEELAGLGLDISLDDFGTGYSSLSLLRELTLHEVKIDKSFVSRMCELGKDAAVVRSTISLAHDLGLRTVAEGVEDARTLASLVDLDCDLVQGYYLSRPVAPAFLTPWLVQHRAEAVAPQPGRAERRRPDGWGRGRPPRRAGLQS